MSALVVKNIYAFLVPQIESQLPGVTVTMENQPFDLGQQVEPFLLVEVEFTDSLQANLGVNPKTRHLGSLNVTAYYRTGTGTVQPREMLWTVAELVKYQSVPPVQFNEPKLLDSQGPQGWEAKLLTVPFVSDPL